MLSAKTQFNSVPHIYDNYVLTFVINGEGTYTIDGVKNAVKKGDAFLTAPNIVTNWSTGDINPIQYIFIVFNGSEHIKILNDTGLGTKSKVFRYLYEEDQSIIKNLYDIYNIAKSNNMTGYELLGQFYLILDYIAKYKKISENNSNTKQNIYFDKAITFISDNYSSNIAVIDIANFLNVDRTYLYKIFKTFLGVSPTSYLIDYRLDKAQQMLIHSNFSNSDIALASGFYDYSHFSHAFKKKFGVTPNQFCKQNKLKDINIKNKNH